MSVNYIVTGRRNPSDENSPIKYYAQVKSKGELTFKELGREMSEISSTVSDTDAIAVLNDLLKIIRRHLSEGKIVRLGDFGSFRLSARSDGAISEDVFHAGYIRSAKILFTPGEDLRAMIRNLKYIKNSK